MSATDITLIGLCADIVGAVLLARGFMQKRAIEAWRESRTHSGSNAFLFKSALLQKAEAWAGTVFLIAGFGLQMAGTIQASSTHSGWITSGSRIGSVLFLMATAGLIVGLAARELARRRFYGAFTRRWKPGPVLPRLDEPDWLHGMCYLYDVKPRDGEADDALLGRLQSRIRYVGQRYGGRDRAIP